MEEGEISTEKLELPKNDPDSVMIKSEPQFAASEQDEEKCVADEKLSESEKELTEKGSKNKDDVKNEAVCQESVKSSEHHVKEETKEDEANVVKVKEEFDENRCNNKPPEIHDTTETEEGELDDSSDEKEKNLTENGEVVKEEVKVNQPASPKSIDNDEIGEVKDGVSRLEFGIDESRPEEEQLDYDEDELEERTKASTAVTTEVVPAVDDSNKEKSDGEVDSASEGEIKSDDDGDFEEGETRDHPLDLPPEQRKMCKFFEMGNCTWGDRCRYLHPGVNDKGNYDMFGEGHKPPPEPAHRIHHEPHPPPEPFWNEPQPFMPPPAAETAWEKGLRHAKELKKRAMQRKVQEPDFMQKRKVLSLNVALNEDHDMEFVNHVPLASNAKGFDPFQEAEDDEYATPTAEELRRHTRILRDRRRGGPPPPHRHPQEKDRRLPPPDHMIPLDIRRERRPPSPRHLPAERYPPEIRRMSPRLPPFEGERDRRGNISPSHNPAFMHRPDDHRGERRDYLGQPFPGDPNRRDLPPEHLKDEKYSSDGSKGPKNLQNGATLGGSEQWSDPWARGRPQARGRNKNKDASSSSTGSSSGSSSRSSSQSSASSHSSFSRSSRSSSRSSASSRSSSFSSHHDSSRSPSPTKRTKPKKKVLSAKQRNAAPGLQKKTDPAQATKTTTVPKPVSQIKTDPSLVKPQKSLQVAAKKPPDNKVVLPIPANSNVPKQITAKKPPEKPLKTKKRTSSSSSEFSHSSDSSPSPSRAKGKTGSQSDSGSSSSSSSSISSSSGSSSSESDEEDKPRNRRKVKPVDASVPKGQVPRAPAAIVRPGAQMQQNKGKVTVPSKPGRKDVKMTIIEKSGATKKRTAGEMTGQKKPSSRRTELLEQLRAVEDAIARKRAKMT